MLYVAVFLMTYTWTLVLRLMSNSGGDSSQEANVFVIMILRAIFLPAMGLGSVLVYVRPRYLQCREYYPQESRLWALSQVLRDTDWKELHRRRRSTAFMMAEGRNHPRHHGNLAHQSPSSPLREQAVITTTAMLPSSPSGITASIDSTASKLFFNFFGFVNSFLLTRSRFSARMPRTCS